MPERNICVDTGCQGYCCQDIDVIITKSERTRLFPQAIKKDSIQELADLKKKNIQGLFYIDYSSPELEGGDFFLLSINGPCPNRLPKGSCSKHEEREYAARNFRIGCGDCNEIRKEHGLDEIFFEQPE
jgi:hypothetical protein